MVGVFDLFSGNSFAKGFAKSSIASVRPTMELQFNQVQNALIGRLNDEIEAATADDGLANNNFDVFLDRQKKKLALFQGNLERFLFDNGRNALSAEGALEKLDALSTALAANDTTAFNSALNDVNFIVENFHQTNGIVVGINVDDGLAAVQTDGLVTYDNGGVATKATSRSDFVDDAAASAAITAATDKMTQILTVLLLRQDSAETIRSSTATKLNALVLEIDAAQVSKETDKLNSIARLREKYGQLLQSLSLAYESNTAMAERISASLFDAGDVQPGSVMNLFA